ncbi:MAG: uridine kinase [Clostridiales bacterium]|nr:uridine kinase [Clostridiales bacterium]
MEQRIVLGIAGGTGSGKTTLAEGIKKALDKDAVLLCHDYYYNSNADMPYEERCIQNYDHPASLETDLLIEHINELREGRAIMRPVYSFVTHTRQEETIEVTPAKVIIIEGILLFENPALREVMDIKVYVDTDSDIRLSRRIKRDVNERGRSLNSVLEQYVNIVKPMHEQFVEPNRKYADVIIPEGGYNQVVLSMITDRLKSFLD